MTFKILKQTNTRLSMSCVQAWLEVKNGRVFVFFGSSRSTIQQKIHQKNGSVIGLCYKNSAERISFLKCLPKWIHFCEQDRRTSGETNAKYPGNADQRMKLIRERSLFVY